MGKLSRDKGAREERAIVNDWRDAGFAAERVPLSGAAQGQFSGDVNIPLQGIDRRFEAKLRADGFRELYRWIEGNYGLMVRADRRERLVVLREADFIALAQAAESARTNKEAV